MSALLGICYLIGLFGYLIKREFVLYYYIIWLAFFPFLLSFFVLDIEQVKYVSGQANYFLAILFIINTIRMGNYSFSIKGLMLIGTIVFLLLLSSLINSAPFADYLRFAISSLLPVYFISSFIHSFDKFQPASFISFLFFILLFEVGLCFVQYNFFIGISPTWLLAAGSFADSNFMWGTFSNGNIVSMFVTLCYLFILCCYNKDWPSYRKWLFYLTTVAVCWCILFSGIRTYLVLLFVFSSIIVYLKAKNKFFFTIILGLGVVFLISAFIVSDYETMASAEKEAGIERQIYGISKIASGDDEGSTLSLSTYLLTEYYNPLDLFGKGQLYKKGYGLVSLENNNEMDATLALYLVEFGLITLFLIVYYLYYQSTIAPRAYRKKKSTFAKLLFFCCFLSTVTDPGIFMSLPLVIIAVFSRLDNQILANEI